MQSIWWINIVLVAALATALWPQESDRPSGRQKDAGVPVAGAEESSSLRGVPSSLTLPEGLEGRVRQYVVEARQYGSALPSTALPDSAVREAVNRWQAAETDEEREAARALIRAALESEYDRALDAYEQYLEGLRKNLDFLRDQIERRRDARDEMVELRIEVLINEADGLQWPGRNLPFPF